jgi:hypothetical protein
MGTGWKTLKEGWFEFDILYKCSISTRRDWTPTMLVLASSSVVEMTMTELFAREMA